MMQASEAVIDPRAELFRQNFVIRRPVLQNETFAAQLLLRFAD
jgi:hypothetical protein